MTHEHYKELLTAQALTALDAADAAAVESHLESCAECREEIVAWEETAAVIALQSKPLRPSDNVREQIVARVRAEKSVGRWESEVKSSDSDSKVLQFGRPQRDVWSSLKAFGAIAAALVFVGLIAYLVFLQRQIMSTRSELASATSRMTEAQKELDRQRALVALVTAPDAHMAKLNGTPMAPGARAMLAYNQNGHAMLMAKGLPAAPKGMAYQLWFIKDNKKMPGKVFQTDADGNGMLEDEIPGVARDSAVFAITLEPETGVQSPTGSVYLVSAS